MLQPIPREHADNRYRYRVLTSYLQLTQRRCIILLQQIRKPNLNVPWFRDNFHMPHTLRFLINDAQLINESHAKALLIIQLTQF